MLFFRLLRLSTWDRNFTNTNALNNEIVKVTYSRSSIDGGDHYGSSIRIKKRKLIGGGMEVELGGSARWDRGMRLKKAYISKTTQPNLKNEYVL